MVRKGEKFRFAKVRIEKRLYSDLQKVRHKYGKLHPETGNRQSLSSFIESILSDYVYRNRIIDNKLVEDCEWDYVDLEFD